MGPLALIMIIIAYLVGSISSAILICRLKKLPDPRGSGSKNPGATNVYRLGGRKAATLVLICDILKGMIPIWVSYFFNISPFMLGLIGIAACLGHMYPIFFHFKGGKGVATALGTLAPIGFSITLMLIGCWFFVILITGYSSLASMITALLAPLFTWLVHPKYTLPVAMLSCLIVLKHHENIRRFFSGKEKKIWQRNNKHTLDTFGSTLNIKKKNTDSNKN